ncbi:unnamed protein product [Darwinula stevensoni]|uniref:TIMELESS-interacting protein n=1 Tax=Darwinula stevensoni TaxID=69355 RepID=A0A7R9A2U7_9CRUS|nr:unnamed protein product [Darwinula stevensoni]CAG0890424.1 unnamed protein product [Darwinula stevensoni]
MAMLDMRMDELFSDPDDPDPYENGGSEGEELDVGRAGTNKDDEAVEVPEPSQKRRVAPKSRIVKNPQPKLNEERLCGERGISALADYFKDVHFKGKNHEKEDLDLILKKLEHWAHRLFPRMAFDDCLERIEQLGTKRAVQTAVKKIRSGMSHPTSSEAQDNANVDVFDEILQQTQTTISTPSTMGDMTNEQRERMEHNRRVAEEKRHRRLQLALQLQSAQDSEPNVNECQDTIDGEPSQVDTMHTITGLTASVAARDIDQENHKHQGAASLKENSEDIASSLADDAAVVSADDENNDLQIDETEKCEFTELNKSYQGLSD